MPTSWFLREWCSAQFGRSWVSKRNVAASYALGNGVKKNGARARKWYERAARAGDESALYDLGMMLLEGEGGPVDSHRGQELVLEAAGRGDGEAQKALAYAYLHGYWGFSVDLDKAEQWKRLALAQGMQV